MLLNLEVSTLVTWCKTDTTAIEFLVNETRTHFSIFGTKDD